MTEEQSQTTTEGQRQFREHQEEEWSKCRQDDFCVLFVMPRVWRRDECSTSVTTIKYANHFPLWAA